MNPFSILRTKIKEQSKTIFAKKANSSVLAVKFSPFCTALKLSTDLVSSVS